MTDKQAHEASLLDVEMVYAAWIANFGNTRIETIEEAIAPRCCLVTADIMRKTDQRLAAFSNRKILDALEQIVDRKKHLQ